MSIDLVTVRFAEVRRHVWWVSGSCTEAVWPGSHSRQPCLLESWVAEPQRMGVLGRCVFGSVLRVVLMLGVYDM